MSIPHQSEIEAILAEGHDMTVATLLPDGGPHATTVSFASDGLKVYFGCSSRSQKAQNLLRDPRVALTVNLAYRDWSQIRGISAQGRVRWLPREDAEAVGVLFARKFSELAHYVPTADEDLALFEVTLEAVSLLNYAKGFGHVDHVRAA